MLLPAVSTTPQAASTTRRKISGVDTAMTDTVVMERRVIYPSHAPASGPLLCHLRQHPLEFDPATRGRREEGRGVRCGRGILVLSFVPTALFKLWGKFVLSFLHKSVTRSDSFSAFITIVLNLLSFIKLQRFRQDPPASLVTYFSTFFHQIAKIQVRSTRGEDRRSRSWEEDGYNMLMH